MYRYFTDLYQLPEANSSFVWQMGAAGIKSIDNVRLVDSRYSGHMVKQIIELDNLALNDI